MSIPRPFTKRSGLIAAVGVLALLLPACEWDGHFTILGYSTRPNYDDHIHTVYVPIFKNVTLYRGLEFELTRAVIRDIEAVTPYKVVSCREEADTELTGTIVNFTKNMLNYNQLGEVREAETVMTAEVIWKDLHTGEALSQPRPRNIESYPVLPPGAVVPSGPGPVTMPPLSAPTAPLPLGTPAPYTPGEGPQDGGLALPEPPKPPAAIPVVIQSTASFIPELGGSLTTAQQINVDRMARQIVHMMEKPW